MKICEKCQTPLADDSAFCTSCGAKVSASASTPEPSSESATAVEANSASMANTNQAAPSSYQSAPAPVVSSSAPVINEPKKRSPYLIATIVVAIAIVVGVAFFFIGKSEGEKNNSTPSSGGGSSNFSPTPSSNSDDPSVSTSSYPTSNVANLGTYSFSIPDGYQYESGVSNGYETLTISDDPSNWVAIIAYEGDITFAQVSSQIDEVGKRNCQDYGNTRVGNTEFYWCDVITQGQYMTRWWSRAGSYVFETITAVNRNAYDHSLMDKVEPILSSAAKRSVTRSMTGAEDAEASPFTETVKPSTVFSK